MTLDPEVVRQLVAEVVARIQTQPATGLTIADSVITLATVERLPSGTKRALISAKAVVTPSAREHARDHGIELMRMNATAAPAASPRPFLIAHADCAADMAPRCAAIARRVPGSQQLPATGLADVVATLATHAARDGARSLLLCGRPAVAVALANRSAGVRAVTARDPATLLTAITETAANIIVVDARAFPAGSLDRVCSDFAARDLPSPPPELSTPLEPPTPCSCKSHAH